MGLVAGLGLGKIQLIILSILVTAIVGQGIALKFIMGSRDKAVAVAAAERTAHETTKHSFLVHKRQTDRNMENQLQATQKLAEARGKAEKERNQLSNLLRKHDLGYLMRKKPGLVERRINSATRDLFEKIQWWDKAVPEEKVPDYETRKFIDNIDDLGYPCWLLYSGYRTPDRTTGRCRFAPNLPSATKTEPDPAGVPGSRGGARGDVRRGYRPKQGLGMPKPPPVREPRPRFQRNRQLFT